MLIADAGHADSFRLGLDAGALFLHAVLIDRHDRVVAREDVSHRGEVLASARDLLSAWSATHAIDAAGVVGSNAKPITDALGLSPGEQIDATLRGLRAQLPGARQIIDAGGSSLALIRLHADGTFAGYQANTLCAAGTGSFLDEQAQRLGIRYADMSDLPIITDPPDIAARCAVFAKSDLIHRQQEGHGRAQCWSGLCRGLARTIVMTLYKGRVAEPPVALLGGVARNPAVVLALQEELGVQLRVPMQPQSCTAHGAALAAQPLPGGVNIQTLAPGNRFEIATGRRPALRLMRSRFPSFKTNESWVDAQGNEIRVHAWPGGARLRVWLGVDIGSTSTKAVMIDERAQVVVDLYRRTAGDPIAATRHLLLAIRDLAQARSAEFEVRGVGTTGSGRKLVGAILGADRVCNEITAHLAGAMRVDPSVDTIFEIGGQDAKYMSVKYGRMHAANMNYVCAAGTGSFVEELARKLGFDLATLGDQLLGVRPPVTSDRCTVFMEQDVRRLLHQGFSRREVMGSVVYSVVQNYLNRVVGRRPRSRQRILFQGATARNKALVAAFEQLLDVEVVVSPLCHVMGAWGVALLTRERMASTAVTAFRGFDRMQAGLQLKTHTCTLCSNRCAITSARVGDADTPVSWGYLCDRDSREKGIKPNPGFGAVKARNRLWKTAGRLRLPAGPEIAIPRTLLTWQYAPFWRRLLGELGYRLRLSGPTSNETIHAAADWVGADYCFPVKLAHGHFRQLLNEPPPLGVAGTDARLLLPFMISERESSTDGHTARAWFCPYHIGLPAMLDTAARLRGADVSKILRATIDLRWDADAAAQRLHRDLGKSLDRTRTEFRRAWTKARESQRRFELDALQVGRNWLERIRTDPTPAVVVMARPYTLYDAGANLALPEKLARLGFSVVPMDLLPLEDEPLGPEFGNMFWNFGRRILAAARYVARTPGVYALGLTNFGCGPDSFVWTYVEKLMGEKPMLVLELDEHGADAGYMTRLEAFADVLRANPVASVEPFHLRDRSRQSSAGDAATLWIPPMHEAAPTLAAAALRSVGIKARALPAEDAQSFARGRCHTRGGECLPCPATLGTYLKTVEHEGGDPGRHALFMPTAEGPCRFGQYCTLDRVILEELGWNTVNILSWSSSDTYAGLSRSGRRRFWTALVLGDLLFKLRCRVAPYEREPGQADATFVDATARLAQGLAQARPLRPLMRGVVSAFERIPQRRREAKPLVGIVGEIYVRQNRFANQELVRTIERNGGEAWLAPLTEWVLYIGYLHAQGLGNASHRPWRRLNARLRNGFLAQDERRWTQLGGSLLVGRHEPDIRRVLRAGAQFVPHDFVGETILTLGRAMIFAREGASMVVNCAPFGCMPGAMTTGILQQAETETGVPMISLTYDGEQLGVNDRIVTYLTNLRRRDAAVSSRERQD